MNKNLFRTCTMVGALAVLVACGENTVGPNGAIAPKGPLYNASVPFNNNGVCMGDDAVAAPDGTIPGVKNGGDPLTATNCTSKDVKIATTTLISYRLGDENGNFSGLPIPYTGQNVTCTTGQSVELTLTAELDETATSERTDIGIWIATDGGEAISGQCNHYNLVNGGQVSDTDGDSCGDLDAGAVVTGFQLGTITTICQVDPTPVTGQDPTQLHVGSCLGWKEPGADATCPMPAPAGTADGADGFRWGTLYGNQAKCNCDGFNVNITVLQNAFLEVQKVCAPTTDGGLFNLQIDAVTEAADAACGGTTGKKTVGAGDTQNPGASHDFGETAGTNTTLSNYTSTRECHDRGGTAGDRLSSASGTGGSVTLQPDDDVICTITNTRIPTVKLVKALVPSTDAGTFDLTIAGTTYDNSGAGYGNNGTTGFKQVSIGTVAISEAAHTGTTLSDYTSSLACVDAAAQTVTVNPNNNTSGSISVAAGDAITCTFTNTRKGSIIIKKETDPDGLSDSFTFTQNVDGSGNFNLSDGGSKTFSNVTPNTSTGYTVTESAKTGFKLQSLSCDNPDAANASTTSGAVATIRVNPGETVTCTYTNLQLATLELRKVENGGLPLSRAWTFELRTGASTLAAGTVVATASANTTTGVVQFSGYFDPGAYQLCETGMPVGYNNNISGFTPLGATAEGGDNSTECINITLVSGANGPGGITGVPNPIDNINNPPSGDARTIGYWKNWSSCTGGKQYIKAQQRGELNKTLDFYLPTGLQNSIYPFGDIAGPLTCDQAVRLLGKSDMVTGKKMASDPAYNLAAQLLAAKLNLAATGACADAVTAINAAQALLAAIDFTGTGTYKNKMTASQISSALSLATTLDQFNNNLLCP